MKVFYNEFDANAAAWIRNLGEAGEIEKGVVDERSIKEVSGADLGGVTRAAFFAGIGGWDLALRIAGWPLGKEVWTGSCPCQPYSSAGKGAGMADARDLWPDFFRLIRERRPQTIFGEQVASAAVVGKAGRNSPPPLDPVWLDRVFADLEGEGYACGAAVLGAHSVGANHIRQRLYWGATLGVVPNTGRERDERRGEPGVISSSAEAAQERIQKRKRGWDAARNRQPASRLGQNADGIGRGQSNRGAISPWSDYEVLRCTDGKARRSSPNILPLAYAWPKGRDMGESGSRIRRMVRDASRSRIGMLKGSGNAIVPELAAVFIEAFREAAGI